MVCEEVEERFREFLFIVMVVYRDIECYLWLVEYRFDLVLLVLVLF